MKDSDRPVKLSKRKWARYFTIFLTIYIVALVTPGVHPYARLPFYIVKCGGLPIAVDGFVKRRYVMPTEGSWGVSPFTEFYCTASEAEAHGAERFGN